jgi:hypothetical protein
VRESLCRLGVLTGPALAALAFAAIIALAITALV